MLTATRLCFDTNALIYLLDRVQPYCTWLDRVFASIASGERQAMLSVITEAELLVQPLRQVRDDEVDRIDVLLTSPNIQILDVDRDIARAGASVRAETRLKLPDALIVATAIVAGCDAVVGNDAMCARRVTEIPYIYLDDAVKEATP